MSTDDMTALVNRRSIMTLYADATDPIGHGVRIVLCEKDINVEVNYVDQDSKPEDLNDLNPATALRSPLPVWISSRTWSSLKPTWQPRKV